MDALFQSFPQERTVGIDLAGRRVFPFVTLWRVQRMFADGLTVELELRGDCRHTPPVLLQIAYVHEILQVDQWDPLVRPNVFHFREFLNRRYRGIFNRRFWEILDRC